MDDTTLAWKITFGCFGIIGFIVWWMWSWNIRRHDGHDGKFEKADVRFREIEFTAVTRDTLNRFANDWRDEINLLRQDGKDKHTENRDWQKRIEDKLDVIVANMSQGVRTVR